MEVANIMKKKFGISNDMATGKIAILFWAIAMGVIARFFVMTFGHNFDFESYKIVGEIVSQGGNVYAETSRYNYGFIFSLIQGIGYKITAIVNIEAVDWMYRGYIVSVLTLADIGISCWLYKNYSIKEALFFLLNPISIIITGYHNQFDNIAVLFALLAINYVDEETDRLTKKDFIAIVMLSLSLLTKHIICVFFGWLLIRKTKKQSIIKRLCYVFIPPVMFLLSFIPFIYKNEDALSGVINNVFLYRSYNNYPIFRLIFEIISVPDEKYFVIYILIMIALGILFKNYNFKDLLMIYLVAMVAFSSAIANQYLVIPIVALVVNRRKKYFLLYEFIGLIYCLLNKNELHLKNNILYHYPNFEWLLEFLSNEGGYMITFMALVLAVFLIENFIHRHKTNLYKSERAV